MEDSILESIKYFSFFNYSPTKEETYCFLKKQVSFDRFTSILEKMVKNNLVNCSASRRMKIENCTRYTLPEYGIKKVQSSKFKVESYLQRQANSIKKLNNWRFKLYTKLISLLPQIKLVGLSGSISMLNAQKDDDIDLFIITAKKRLFTGRFLVIVMGYVLGVKRERVGKYSIAPSGHKNKVCLNLFFDESNLVVPKFKQGEYVAHEVLQMKPIIDKDQTYKKFLKANLWVTKIFPNSTLISSKFKVQNFKFLTVIFHFSLLIFNLLERLLKSFQLASINRHKTNEIITKNQLWFHPEDFSKKMKNLPLDK